MKRVILKRIHLKVMMCVAFVVIGSYAAMVFAVNPLSQLVIHTFKENSNWQANRALESGKVAEAIEIASRQVEAEEFEFAARRILSLAFIRDMQSTAAVSLLLGSLDKGHSISRRNVYSRGFNPAADYKLLSRALADTGNNAFSMEMARAARDAERLYEPNKQPVDEFPISDNTPHAPATDSVKLLNLNTFHCTAGATLTKTGILNLSRNSTCKIIVPSASESTGTLWLQVRGGRPMGFGALLRISLEDKELIRIYADKEQPRWVSVPFHKNYSADTMELTAQFLNDEFDPVTKADRNVDILQIGTAQ